MSQSHMYSPVFPLAQAGTDVNAEHFPEDPFVTVKNDRRDLRRDSFHARSGQWPPEHGLVAKKR
jgi:hypothetical protein